MHKKYASDIAIVLFLLNIFSCFQPSYGQILNTATDEISVSPQVSGGWTHSIALNMDGIIWAWGYNEDGQLGDGTKTSSNTPVRVKTDNSMTFTSISAGGDHNLALNSHGRVYAWGVNDEGQLGNGSFNDSTLPVLVSDLSDVISIQCGGEHSLAIKSDGTLWAWGLNNEGQLGTGDDVDNSAVPIRVKKLSNVTDIAAGEEHTLALLADGTVWAWGLNDEGQLGNGTTISRFIPVMVEELSDIVSISCGAYFSLALDTNNTLWAWGLNEDGALGDGTTSNRLSPVKVDIKNVADVVAGDYHSIALKENGFVQAWGLNDEGQLGNGTKKNSATPVRVSNLNNIFKIAAGEYHSIALAKDGTVWAWGLNDDGQLGTGSTDREIVPVQVDINLGEIETTSSACVVDHLDFTPEKVILFVGETVEVKITLTGEDGCMVAEEDITMKVSNRNSKFISVSPTDVLKTDENGEATFTVSAKEKTGRAKIIVKVGDLKEVLVVKIKD